MFQDNHPKFHRETKEFAALIVKANQKPLNEYESMKEARDVSRSKVDLFAGSFDFRGIKSELFLPSPDVQGGIPVYVYKPHNIPNDPTICVFYHGGGMALGSRDHYDVTCKKLATLSECIFVNVEYRLSPEYKYPSQFEDAKIALEWVLKNKKLIGGGSSSLIGVVGDSAGGTLAASTAHYTAVDFQVLIYPRCFPNRDFNSFKEFHTSPGLPVKLIEWFESMSIRNEADNTDPRYRVGLHDTFVKDPPSLFIIAECDPLCDDGLAYKQKLDDAGIHTELLMVKGACHAYWNLSGIFEELCSQSDKVFSKFIKMQKR